MAILNKEIRNFIDVDFNFIKHPITNNLPIKRNVNAVKQSVMNLLTLKEYDVPFHPEIKSPIYRFLFENFSIIEKLVLEGEIRKYLNVYEPRLKINTVTIYYPSPNEIQCSIVGELLNLMEPITVNVLINRLR